MAISATGTSVKGRQVLGSTNTLDRFFTVVWTAYNDSSPVVRKLGTLILEQDRGNGDWAQVQSMPIWTNGAVLDYTFNPIGSLRMVVQWEIAGLAWSATSAGTPR